MKVAVIGTGISGMGAAWLLSQQYDVTVYEANSYIGGHSNTRETLCRTSVDTGFIVYNEHTYPNLIHLFDHLGVHTERSDMSFAVSMNDGDLEYSGGSMLGLFAQKTNLFRPSYYSLLMELVRFYKNANSLLEQSVDLNFTLGDYLDQHQYSKSFIENHLLPMGAAIWSTTATEIRDFPAHTFIRFFENHGLLKLNKDERPKWRTVTGGSREYVEKLTESYQDKIRLNSPVKSVRRTASGVEITDHNGQQESYDQVVMACHGDQSLPMITDATDMETQILSQFKYSDNRAILHQDPSQMPKRKAAWASWNYLADTKAADTQVCVTYWMNLLQNLKTEEPVFVTLNPIKEPDPAKVIEEISYQHPLFTRDAIAAQGRIREIQGTNRLWYCGAWMGYGFHEDGLSSGLAVAEALGAKRPWTCHEMSPAGENAIPVTALREAAE